MSKSTYKMKRIERRQRKLGVASLNVVSLMDIFTILVFFLLVNSAAVEVLPNAKALTLPKSVATERAQEVPVIMVTREQIILQYGSQTREIMSISAASAIEAKILPPVKYALNEAVGLIPVKNDPRRTSSRGDINVMADKDVPFSLLKKVMATCTEARFAKISLAVIHNPGSDSE